MHKNVTPPPGRPIVAGIDSLTSRAILVDEFLKPLVQKLPLFMKDSMHLLKICQTLKLPPNALLVTIDVESLYSNIPHSKGIQTVKEFILELNTDQQESGAFILDLLRFILTHNYFMFVDSHYLQ